MELNHIKIQKSKADQLLPLLDAIGHEIADRADQLAHVETMSRALSIAPHAHRDELSKLRSEGVVHMRELKRAEEELRALGCSVANLEPLTFRIGDRAKEGFTWIWGTSQVENALAQEQETSTAAP